MKEFLHWQPEQKEEKLRYLRSYLEFLYELRREGRDMEQFIGETQERIVCLLSGKEYGEEVKTNE